MSGLTSAETPKPWAAVAPAESAEAGPAATGPVDGQLPEQPPPGNLQRPSPSYPASAEDKYPTTAGAGRDDGQGAPHPIASNGEPQR